MIYRKSSTDYPISSRRTRREFTHSSFLPFAYSPPSSVHSPRSPSSDLVFFPTPPPPEDACAVWRLLRLLLRREVVVEAALRLGRVCDTIVPRRVCLLFCVLRATSPSGVAVVASGTLTSGSCRRAERRDQTYILDSSDQSSYIRSGLIGFNQLGSKQGTPNPTRHRCNVPRPTSRARAPSDVLETVPPEPFSDSVRG